MLKVIQLALFRGYMEASKTIEDLGKYFNEILGYLLPGLTLAFIVYYFVDIKYVNTQNISYLTNAWMILFIGYITGYVVYGFSLLRDRILDVNYVKYLTKITIRDRKIFSFLIPALDPIMSQISNSIDYKLAKEELSKLIPNLETDKCNPRVLRSYAMSYVPEYDQKIYTFMFRADLFDHLKIIFYIISMWAIIAKCFDVFFSNAILFDLNGNNFWYALILLVLTVPLKLGRKRFLGIAYKIQFSMFISKCHPIK